MALSNINNDYIIIIITSPRTKLLYLNLEVDYFNTAPAQQLVAYVVVYMSLFFELLFYSPGEKPYQV